MGKHTRLFTLIGFFLLLFIGSSVAFITTSEGSKNTTHTLNSRQTPTPTPMPTATPATTTSLTPQPLFADYFDGVNKGWTIGDNAGYTRIYSDNKLTLSNTNHKTLVESLPTTATFDDFSLTTTLTIVQGDEHDSAGLYLRGDSNLDHDYRIDFYSNGRYAISKESLGDDNIPVITYLAGPEKSSVLKKQGEPNTINVIMKGTILMLLINGHAVTTLEDDEYKSGQVAFFAENGNTSSGITTSISGIEIDAAPDDMAVTPTVVG